MTALPYPEAIAAMKARVACARTSFHAGMAILPKARREAMYAFYAFCREVDDIADSAQPAEERMRALNAWRERVASLFRGDPSEEITSALAPAVRRFGLVEKDFQDLITGMEMDAGDPIFAPDEAALDRYCDCVASAVGRVSVRIFGDASEAAMQVARHLGRALQLTNILRDLGEDAARGRLYLPKELLEKHGIALAAPGAILRDSKLPGLCRELAARAAGHFAEADRLMRSCKPSSMRPARIMRAYYAAVLEKLLTEDWRDPFTRVTLPKWRKLWLVLKSFMG